MDNSFYVIKPRLTKTDIYYKVYITDTSFYFIKVGGQFHNRYAYEKQLPDLLELIFMFWFKKMERKKKDMEALYDELVRNNQVSDLLQKKHNFSISYNEIVDIRINSERTLHTGYHDNGTLSIAFKNNKVLKFIIPRTTLRKEIIRCISEAQPELPLKVEESRWN